MKTINLHFKDAVVSRLEEGKYLFTFDLSGLIFDRFSKNTRVYLNNLSLCEFRDNLANKELGGFFEIGCNFVNDSDVVDSSGNSSGNTMIYQGNLNSYHTFSNPAPLFSYNFKINESAFNSGRLQFVINFYNEQGNQFVSWNTQENVFDTSTTEYATFITFKNYLDSLKNDLVVIENKLNILAQRHINLKSTFDTNAVKYLSDLDDFIDILSKVVSGKRVKTFCVNNGISFQDNVDKHTEIENFLRNSTITEISNFFNAFDISQEPYFATNKTGLAQNGFPDFKDGPFLNRFSNFHELEEAMTEYENFDLLDVDHSTLTEIVGTFHIEDQKSAISNIQMFDYTSVVYANATVNNNLIVENHEDIREYSATATYVKKKNGSTQVSPYTANLKIFMQMRSFQKNNPRTTTIIPDCDYFPTIVKIVPVNRDIATTHDNLEDVDSTIYIEIGNESGSDQAFNLPLANILSIPQVSNGTVNAILKFELDPTAVRTYSRKHLQKMIPQYTNSLEIQKAIVPTITYPKSILFSDAVEKKLPAINMSLVLYDEEPLEQEYENSKNPVKAINKNSLSTLNLPSFRRF